ncbi:hypothetical protein EAF04_002303 [Stromatinia cepivora]|nr:hypothetical protein EAF04_002303 [Stromatinia cepivora]
MRTNHVVGVLVVVLTAFMVLFGMGIYYFARAMQRRRFRARHFGQSSMQSRSTRASAQRSDRKHRTYQARSERSRRLSDIAEEWPNGGSQDISSEATSDETAESILQLEQIPASHGCNQTCHGHAPRPGERQVGLGIAHGKGRPVYA